MVLTTDGVQYVHIVDEKVNGEVFLTFVRKYFSSAIQSVGAIVKFLPSYSPDMNPIEEFFSEEKHYLKANSDVYQATASPKQIILSTLIIVSVSKLHQIESRWLLLNTQYCMINLKSKSVGL